MIHETLPSKYYNMSEALNYSPSLVGVIILLLFGSVHDCEYLLEQGMDIEQRCDDASHRQEDDNFTLLQLAT
jgi:hypothetical protein